MRISPSNNLKLLIVSFFIITGCKFDQKKDNKNTVKFVNRAKFEPDGNKVLVFVGQDNLSVGGNDNSILKLDSVTNWNTGYIDFFEEKIGLPAGITHYIYMVESNKQNKFGRSFKEGIIEGLNSVDEWAAGDMCMRCYLSNQTNKFKNSVIHLSISMEFDAEIDIANGKSDDLIQELGDFLKEFSEYPFILRIGYEFNGSWNSYDPENFKIAFKRIVDKLKERKIENFATLMASSSMHIKEAIWDTYYPGDDYVDWVGYSYFNANPDNDAAALKFARKHKKPVFIAEATPWKGTEMDKQNGSEIWNYWFKGFFEHIENNKDVIKAISYINADWRTQDMWKNTDNFNINTRLQANEYLTNKWIDKMNEELYIHNDTDAHKIIGFKK